MEVMTIDEFRRSKVQEPVELTHWVKISSDELYHGGPGSGRYPWGSGDRPYQRLEQAHGGIFRRKRRTTESMRDTLNKAQERIDAHAGKSQEDLRRERSDEKREEKNREERPLTYFVKDLNKRVADAPTSEEAATRWKKTQKSESEEKRKGSEEKAKRPEPESKTSEEKTKRSEPESKTYEETPKQSAKQSKEKKEVKRELRDLRTDRQASEMSNADLDEYLNRRRKVDEYNRYRTADKLATINAIDDVVKSGRSAYDNISKSINDKYVAAHKQAKIDKANAELKDMSDEDLQKRVKRMNLEKQYRDLSPEVTIQGEDTTRRILSAIGTTLTVAQIAMPIARGFATSYEPKRR